MAAINTGIESSLLKFTFSDDEGEVLASFRMNPADVKLSQRCQEVSSFFEELKEKTPENATLEDAVKMNNEVEDKMCYLLGYDAKQSLFGQISATSVLGDGNMFVTLVMEKIVESVAPEIKRRKQAMSAAVEKHTAKYTE